MLELLSLFGAAILVAPQDARPSFDCARATTSVEQAICADRELAELDRRVAERYASVRLALPAASRDDLAEDQQWFLSARDEWYENRDRWDGYPDLKGRMTDRIAFLETIRADRGEGVDGQWRNLSGTVDIERTGPDSIRVRLNAVQPVNARWICELDLVVNRHDGVMEGVVRDDPDWQILITPKPGHIEVEQIKLTPGFGLPSFCGANGSVSGVYFRVG